MSYIAQLKALSMSELEAELDRIAGENFRDLIDEEEVNSVITDTNATGWGCETYGIVKDSIVIEDDEVRVDIRTHATGDNDEDQPWVGDALDIEAVMVLDDDGNVSFEDVTTSLNWPDDDLVDASE